VLETAQADPATEVSGRVLGLDLGARYIGIALSDSARRVAVPHGILVRGAEPAGDYRCLAAVVAEVGAVRVVAGLPLGLSGARGPAAAGVLAELAELGEVLCVPVDVLDERLTTRATDLSGLLAGAGARAGGAGRLGGAGRGGRPRRGNGSRARGAKRPTAPRVFAPDSPEVAHRPDAAAAALILEGWLAARR
jgi:putative transcription antitermination factor YqgF